MGRTPGASLGICVHVTGALSFPGKAERLEHETQFIGPATSADALVGANRKYSAGIAVIDRRLTAGTGHAARTR